MTKSNKPAKPLFEAHPELLVQMEQHYKFLDEMRRRGILKD
jgi:hypothetical protein